MQYHTLLLRGRPVGVPAWFAARGSDRDRNAVRIRVGFPWHLDIAPRRAGPAATVQNTAGATGPDPGRDRMLDHDCLARHIHADGRAWLDVDRIRGLLLVRARPQQIKRGGA